MLTNNKKDSINRIRDTTVTVQRPTSPPVTVNSKEQLARDPSPHPIISSIMLLKASEDLIREVSIPLRFCKPKLSTSRAAVKPSRLLAASA